ncbi:hypothetical protein V8C37DRAFT_391109 [Trichoderma ceciliae]
MVTPLTGRQRPSTLRLTEDIYNFLQVHQQRRILPVATGSSGSSEPIHFDPRRGAHEDASFSSEDFRSRPSEMHVSSAGSGETRRSSVFDSSRYSSSTSSVLPRRQLPCEFYWYGDCEETFDLDNIDGWVHHIVSQHLGMALPMNCRCWFCDDFVFHAESELVHERRRCYTARMRHIADHFRRGATTDQVRPDFDFVDHLQANDLITRRDFRHSIGFHEAPQPKNGINSVPSAPSMGWEMAVEVRLRYRGRPESRRSYYP